MHQELWITRSQGERVVEHLLRLHQIPALSQFQSCSERVESLGCFGSVLRTLLVRDPLGDGVWMGLVHNTEIVIGGEAVSGPGRELCEAREEGGGHEAEKERENEDRATDRLWRGEGGDIARLARQGGFPVSVSRFGGGG